MQVRYQAAPRPDQMRWLFRNNVIISWMFFFSNATVAFVSGGNGVSAVGLTESSVTCLPEKALPGSSPALPWDE